MCYEHGGSFFFFRIVGYGVAGCEPTIMGIGPVPSIQVGLQIQVELKKQFIFEYTGNAGEDWCQYGGG